MDNSLEVYEGDRLVFSSRGSWIYPLFELEDYLAKTDHRPEGLLAVDKVVGKAAAMVMVRLGIGSIEAGMASELARDFLERQGTPMSWQELVPRILCKTEELLKNVDDVDEAYSMLRERARKSELRKEKEGP
jgi:hypothetical protein